MNSNPLTIRESINARRFLKRIVLDRRQPVLRRISAIELDNWIVGDSPMPAGGDAEIRKCLRNLRAAARVKTPKQCDGIRRKRIIGR